MLPRGAVTYFCLLLLAVLGHTLPGLLTLTIFLASLAAIQRLVPWIVLLGDGFATHNVNLGIP